MSVIKRVKKDKYTVIDNQPLQDKTLSLPAKGLLSYIMSLPENWTIRKTQLQNGSASGREMTKKAFNDLIKAGYIKEEKTHSKENGRFEFVYYVADEPIFKPVTGNRKRETVNGNPSTGTRTLINKDNSKELSNKESKEKKEARAFFEELAGDMENIKDTLSKNEAEEKRKKVAAKKEKEAATVPASLGSIKNYEITLQNFTYPPAWTEEIKAAFLKYCESMDEKRRGRWGYLTNISENVKQINEYLRTYPAEYITGALLHAAKNGNTQYNPLWHKNRIEKEKKDKEQNKNGNNYDAVRAQLNDPNFLNIVI